MDGVKWVFLFCVRGNVFMCPEMNEVWFAENYFTSAGNLVLFLGIIFLFKFSY